MTSEELAAIEENQQRFAEVLARVVQPSRSDVRMNSDIGKLLAEVRRLRHVAEECECATELKECQAVEHGPIWQVQVRSSTEEVLWLEQHDGPIKTFGPPSLERAQEWVKLNAPDARNIIITSNTADFATVDSLPVDARKD